MNRKECDSPDLQIERARRPVTRMSAKQRYIEISEVESLMNQFVSTVNLMKKRVMKALIDHSVEIPSVSDISSTVDMSCDNIPDISISKVKQEKVMASTSKNSNPDKRGTTKKKIEKNSANLENEKPNTRSKAKDSSTSTKTTRTNNKPKETKSNNATDNPATNNTSSKKNGRVVKGTKTNSSKSELPKDSKAGTTAPPKPKTKRVTEKKKLGDETGLKNEKKYPHLPELKRVIAQVADAPGEELVFEPNPTDDRKVGLQERRLLKREERRRKRRTLRHERRLARAIGELSRIISDDARKNGYLPAADQEQQDRSTHSAIDSDFLDSSCSCSDSSCSCWMYSDSDESTDTNVSDEAVVGRSR